MNLSDITVEVRDRNLTRVGQLTEGFRLEATPLSSKVGSWVLTLPADHPLAAVLREPGSGIVVTGPDDVIISGPVTAPAKSVTTADLGGSLEFTGSCDNQWVADYLAWPDPSNADSETQAYDYDVRTGMPETVMHGYVNANIGPDGPDGRRIDRLVMGPDLGRGPLDTGDDVYLGTSKSARFDELDTLITGISSEADLTWRVVQRGDLLRFETDQTRDLSKTVRLDTRNSTLSGYKMVTTAPTATHAIVGAQDVDDDRLFATVTTPESQTASAEWGRRIERFVNQSYVDDVDEWTASAKEMLADEGKTVTSVQAIPNDDENLRFGRDYRLGDSVSVVADNREHVSVVTGTVLKIDETGVRIALILGDATVFNPVLNAKTKLAKAETRIALLERNAIIGKIRSVIDAETAADTAQATANIKTTTTRQPTTPPTSTTIGDEWIDDSSGRRYLAAAIGADSVTSGEWEEAPTRAMSTADSGERIVIRNDGSGGIIESFSGVTGELTPGVIDPAALSARPTMLIRTGTSSTCTDAAELDMRSGTPGNDTVTITAHQIMLRSDVVGSPPLIIVDTTETSIQGSLNLGGSLVGAGNAHVGYRSTAANQTLVSGALTKLDLAGTADHYVGAGFTITSDVVTITFAGVYQLHGFCSFNVATGNCRNILRIETWTGSDPGVGLGAIIAGDDVFANTTTFNGINCWTQKAFAAGQKLRLLGFQNQGTNNTTQGGTAGLEHQLNIRRVS